MMQKHSSHQIGLWILPIVLLFATLASSKVCAQVSSVSPDTTLADSSDAPPNSLDTWIESTTLSKFVKENENWVWPTCEILHFIGLSFLIGCIGVLDFRLIGIIKELKVQAINSLMRWGIGGFIINLVTGMMFFFDDPGQYSHNVAFFWKISFIVLAGLNVSIFYVFGIAKRVERLQPGEGAPLEAKIVGGASLFLWFGVLYFGRMLPYLGNSF